MLLPPSSELAALTDRERSETLGSLFERSSALEGVLQADLEADRFQDYDSLISLLAVRLGALLDRKSSLNSTSTLDNILSCHPRLGSSDPTALSVPSRAEQARLQSATSSAAKAEAAELASLNERYESQFSGLVYLVFVNGRPRTEIMADMRMRLERGDLDAERRAGIVALCDIARDRLRKAEVAGSLAEWRQWKA